MKAKEKAKELVDRFRIGDRNMKSKAKQCALICVDEMIKNIIWSSDFNGSKRKELEEVKQEIEKL